MSSSMVLRRPLRPPARGCFASSRVRLRGGSRRPSPVQQCLRAGRIGELHIAIAPALLGGGERLFDHVDLPALGYECVRFVGSDKAAHVVLRRP